MNIYDQFYFSFVGFHCCCSCCNIQHKALHIYFTCFFNSHLCKNPCCCCSMMMLNVCLSVRPSVCMYKFPLSVRLYCNRNNTSNIYYTSSSNSYKYCIICFLKLRSQPINTLPNNTKLTVILFYFFLLLVPSFFFFVGCSRQTV